MITRKETVSFYSDKLKNRGISLDENIIERLPPVLCQNILYENDIKIKFDLKEQFTGENNHKNFFYNDIMLSADGLELDLQKRLPLKHHYPINAKGIFKWITYALDELKVNDIERFNFINDWCSLIVWLKKDINHPETTELTSTAIPALPFATFITKKIIRHIPPKTILPEINYYGIQENLFHEALHHQLSATIISNKVFTNPEFINEMILIPWRNCSWPLDRCFHALFVYNGVIKMRKEHISRYNKSSLKFIDTFKNSINEGMIAMKHLLSEIDKRKFMFSEYAIQTIESIDRKINKG